MLLWYLLFCSNQCASPGASLIYLVLGMICPYYLNKVKSGTCRLSAACRNQWSVKLQHQTARIIAQKGANVPATFTEHFYNDWIKRKKYRFKLYSAPPPEKLCNCFDLCFSFHLCICSVKHLNRFISALRETCHIKPGLFLSSFWPFRTFTCLISHSAAVLQWRRDPSLLTTDTFSCTYGVHILIKFFITHANVRKPDTHDMGGGITETRFCPVRDVPSSAWFVRLYYTQIQLVIRLLLDHSKKPPQIPATHPLTLWLVLKLIFHLTGGHHTGGLRFPATSPTPTSSVHSRRESRLLIVDVYKAARIAARWGGFIILDVKHKKRGWDLVKDLYGGSYIYQ